MRAQIGVLLAGLATSAGCADRPTPAAPPPATVFEVRQPTAVQTVVAESERVALKEIHQGAGRRLCRAMMARDAAAARAELTDDLRAKVTDLSAQATEVRGLRAGTLPGNTAEVDAAAFAT